MAERMSAETAKEFVATDPYEQDREIQRAVDAFRLMGVELSLARIGTEELADEIAEEVQKRIISMAEDGVDIGQAMLIVSGASVSKTNFLQASRSDEDNNVVFSVTIDPEHPTIPLAVGEERRFCARRIYPCTWKDEEAGCWRVGLKIHGDDPQSIETQQITTDDEMPLFSSHVQGYIEVLLDESAQLEVESLVKKRAREASINSLRGHFSNGIVRLLKAIDHEMAAANPDVYNQLKHVHNLRLLGKHGMNLTDLKKVDLLNTAITKVFDGRAGRIVAGGVGYDWRESGNSNTNEPVHITISGVVADVIDQIPVATEKSVGPSLVLVGRSKQLDNPTYMPLKDLKVINY